MRTVVRWNVSKKAKSFSEADVFLVSFPKSGRTWIRIFLYSYFAFCEKREFTLDERTVYSSNLFPRLVFTHDLWEHVTSKTWDRIRGKFLIPGRLRRERAVLLIGRDPRDVIVSLYFQLANRDRVFNGSLSDMLRHQVYGIQMMVDIMNSWISEWGERPDFKLISYESCKLDTERVFREILDFIGIDKVDEEAFAKSLEFSRFENMKNMEAGGRFDDKILKPGDLNDQESFKVRKGKVGGYREYLTVEDIGYSNLALTSLDPRYGYSPFQFNK
ncbi:MAG: sulfotransferase domain-containing protein [Deltaproteobacteria bacterium]|nr:sulfotransferase domain-containing protein [Deltaproteobacteria bacterium]